MKNKDTVMIFGTFDKLHQGHLSFINQAASLGQNLIIVIARVCNVNKFKKKKPRQNENKRLKSVQDSFNFAKVILGDCKDIYKPIRENKPDLIAFGYDQKVDICAFNQCFPKIKTTLLKPYQANKYKSSLM